MSSDPLLTNQVDEVSDEMNAEVDSILDSLDHQFQQTEYSDEEKEILAAEDKMSEDKKLLEDLSEEKEASDSAKEKVTEKVEESTGKGPSVEFKVNGEIVNMTMDEIKEKHPEALESFKEHMSGQLSWSKKFKELDTERKSFYDEKKDFESEKRAIEDYIEQSRQRLEGGNIEDSVKVLSELGGIPFHQYKAQLLQWALPQLVAQQEMTPEQIRIQELEAERAYEREQQESRSKRAEAEQSKQELVARINEAREAHNITDEEWDTGLKEASKLKDLNELKIEDVVQVIQSTRVDNTALEVINEIDEFPKESTDTLKQIILNNPDFDKETIKDIVVKALESSKQNTESKKVEKEVVSKIGGKLKPTKKEQSEEEKQVSEVDHLINKYLK